MAQKTLNAQIVISGRVDNSLGTIGSALLNLGSVVDGVSQKLIDFGKDSVNVYRSYEDSMLDTEVALSTTYGRGTQALRQVMTQIDASATEWAASSIFHTNDVANAISEAAHANWDLEMILDGMPAAMRLAQAGGLDLSEAVNYMIKTANAAKIEFGELTGFVDEWVYTANKSAGDVDTFGEAMLRMGSTTQYAGDPTELLTMLAVLHDAGTIGAEAGTLLRNSMIRLVAPTQTAMDTMADLAVTQADIDEAMSEVDGDVLAASKRLDELGFSAYDSEGNLKSFLDIFRELAEVTAPLSEEEKYGIWASIFPTRTITGAMALMDAALNDYNGLFAEIEAGAAEGYGAYAAETMMSGLTGSIETFNSKLERLKQLTGAELSGQIMQMADWGGDIIDSIAEMDEDKFSLLVSGLEGIAVAGPGMLVAGNALRLIGMMITPTGALAGGIAILAAGIGVVKQWQQIDFESKFGNIELDAEALSGYIESLGSGFRDTAQYIETFRTELDTAVQSYETASTAFAGDVLTAMLTKKEFTPEDRRAMEQTVGEMQRAVIDTIQASADMSAEFWAALFGADADGNEAYAGIIGTLVDETGELTAQATAIGERINAAIADGFANGFTPETYDEILAGIQEYNRLVAQAEQEAAAEEYEIQRTMMLHKAQTMGLDDFRELQAEVNGQRDEELKYWRDLYEYNRAKLVLDKGEDSEEVRAADAAWANKQAEIYANYSGLMNDMYAALLGQATAVQPGIFAEYAGSVAGQMLKDFVVQRDGMLNVEQLDALTTLLPTADRMFEGSDIGGAYDAAKTAAQGVMTGEENGRLTFDRLFNTFYGEHKEKNGELLEELTAVIDALGGPDVLSAAIPQLYAAGDTETATIATQLYQTYNFVGSQGTSLGEQGYADWVTEGNKYFAENPVHAVIETTDGGAMAYTFTTNAQYVLDQNPGKWKIITDTIANGNTEESPMPLYAEGGRATEPSIFGEAGAEWAIPEEHTARTLSLLRSAAEASGFAWGEMGDGGGTSGGDGSGGVQIEYSPVIHAENADGVERVLRADKARLKRMIEQILEERELYESVVAYR